MQEKMNEIWEKERKMVELVPPPRDCEAGYAHVYLKMFKFKTIKDECFIYRIQRNLQQHYFGLRSPSTGAFIKVNELKFKHSALYLPKNAWLTQ